MGFIRLLVTWANHANRSQNIAIISLYCVLAFRCEIVLPARKNAVTGLCCAVTAWYGQLLACLSQKRINRYCNISVYIYYAQTEQPEIVHHQQKWYILLNIYWHILCAVLILGQPKQWTLKTEHSCSLKRQEMRKKRVDLSAWLSDTPPK